MDFGILVDTFGSYRPPAARIAISLVYEKLAHVGLRMQHNLGIVPSNQFGSSLSEQIVYPITSMPKGSSAASPSDRKQCSR